MKKISIVCLIVFFIDRVTKILVTSYFELNIRNIIVDNFFYITNCHNKGAAFSLFTGNVIFLVFITLAVLYLIYKMVRKKDNISMFSALSYGLLLGGILGNLFDRVVFGYVIDFLDFIIFKMDFAVFNVADIAIVCGAIMLLIFEGSGKSERRETISN